MLRFLMICATASLATAASAQPHRLTDKQMDSATAGSNVYTCDPQTGCGIKLGPATPPSIILPPAVQLPNLNPAAIADALSALLAGNQPPVVVIPDTPLLLPPSLSL
jgi:hypothetical protein